MELKKTCLDTFEAAGTIALTQEETAETIVPDYCPDIARIIRTDGRVYLHSRQIRDGKAEVSGTVRISVLYTPDGEKGLRTLEFAMPFSAESERGSFSNCRSLLAETELAVLETRMLNPRKVFTRCKLVSHLTGYRKAQLVFGSDIDAESELCMEKKQTKESATLLTAISEKDFSFTDDILLSSGREGAAEILSSHVVPIVSEARMVGNKLSFKGIFRISLFYREKSGKCLSMEAELPFSQIMESEERSENALAEVCLQLTGADMQISPEDNEGRQIAVTFYFHAMAFVYQAQELTLLEDLYSTRYQTRHEADTVILTPFRETLQRRQSMREMLEIGVVAESVLSLRVQCGPVSVGREGQTCALRTTATIRALYRDEGDAVLFAERSAEAVCHLEIPEGCTVSAEAICIGEIQSSIGERGIEVRFPVEFTVKTESKVRRVCISALHMEGELSGEGAPSLVLRRLHPKEKLWDVAKRYRTTVGEILAANELEDEGDAAEGKLLLIPKKRA